MASRTAHIGSRIGLHARPAAIFANAAAETDADITLTFDGEEADAASTLGVMSLGVMHGDEVTISTDAPNADEILDQLVALLESDLDTKEE